MMTPSAVSVTVTAATTTVKARIDAGSPSSW